MMSLTTFNSSSRLLYFSMNSSNFITFLLYSLMTKMFSSRIFIHRFDQSVFIFLQSVFKLIHVSNMIKNFRVFRYIVKYLDKNNWYSMNIFYSWEFLFCIDWFDWLLVFRNNFLVNHDFSADYLCRYDSNWCFLDAWFFSRLIQNKIIKSFCKWSTEILEINNKIWEFCIVSK
jgi:hypothetical protein